MTDNSIKIIAMPSSSPTPPLDVGLAPLYPAPTPLKEGLSYATAVLTSCFPVLQVVFLVLTGVSVLLYLVSMVVSSKLVCRPRSTSMIFRWSIVARASLLAGK